VVHPSFEGYRSNCLVVVLGAATCELLEEFKILSKEHDVFWFTTHDPMYLNRREYDVRCTRYRLREEPVPSALTVSQYVTIHDEGHAVAQWFSHYATNQKVAESIPDGVIRIFH
jgi:hypothetical protein